MTRGREYCQFLSLFSLASATSGGGGGVMDSGDQGGGEAEPHQVHRFLAFLSFSEQYDSTMEEIGGADPLRSFQGVRRGGRSAHLAGPGSGFRGRWGRGQQPHDRQVGFHGAPQEGHRAYPVDPSSGYHNRQGGFHGTPQEGHHAYPVDPSSGYHNRQVGFYGTPQEGHHAYPAGPSSGYATRPVGFHGIPQGEHHAYPVGPSSGYTDRQGGFYGTPQEGHHAYPVGPSSGHPGMQGWGREFHGVSRQRARPYERPVIGGVGGDYPGRGVQRGPYSTGGPRGGPNYGNRGGSGRGAGAAPGPAGGSGAISYAGAVVEGQGTVRPRGVAGRGSAPGRGAGRGVTIAQSPAQLAHAAAQRDARESGQGRVAAVGGRSARLEKQSGCIIPGCKFTCGGGHKRHAVGAHLPKLYWEISGSTSLPGEQMAQLLELVRFIACSAIGCSVEELTVGALQRHWRSRGFEARPVLPTVTPLVRGLEAFAGWESPAEYSASPPNSIALLLQWNVALSLVGTMGSGARDRCHTWQPSTQAPTRAMEVEGETPASEVQVVAGSSALTGARASGEASVSAGAPVVVGAVASARAATSGTGTSGEGGWKEAGKKKKKKKKVGSKPQGTVSITDLKSELSAISLGESQTQGQVVGGGGGGNGSYGSWGRGRG